MPPQTKHHFGRIQDPRETEKLVSQLHQPLFGLAAPHLQDSGKGKDVFLWDAEKAVLGQWLEVHRQTIGDCVSHGTAGAIDTLRCVRIAVGGYLESYSECSTEVIYGGSRVEIGGGRIRGDGSIGAWAIDFILKYGIVKRDKYPDLDVSKYSGALAKRLGQSGIPTSIENIAKQTPALNASLVTTYDQLRDGIAGAKCPAIICSNYGFEPYKRGSDGFIKAGGTWPHCVYALGVTDNQKRPGIALRNSWGNNMPSGPKRITLPSGLEIDLPEGVWFVDAPVIDKMLREQDSFLITDVTGYPARDFEYRSY